MKRSFVYLLIAMIVIVALGSHLTDVAIDDSERHQKAHLMSQAELASVGVNMTQVQGLTGSLSDLGSTDYEGLKAVMTEQRAVMSHARFVYIVGQLANGTVFIYVDSEPTTSPDYSPPGQIYYEASGEFDQAFAGNASITGPMADRWGTWITAMVPLRDPTSGEVVAVLGVDMDAAEWGWDAVMAGLPPALATALLATTVLIFFFIRRRKEADELRSTETMKVISESEAKYRLLVNSAAEAIVVAQDGMLRLVNPATSILTGYSEQELLSMPLQSIVHPNDHAMLIDRARRRAKGEVVPARYSFSILAKDGSTKWVEINAEDIEWEGRSATLTFLTDITERKKAEEALRASQQFIEGVINAIPVRVFWKDRNLVYLGCNEIFARDAGFNDPKEVIGKDDYQMIWRDQADMYRKDDFQVIESGSSKLSFEEPQITPNGNFITLLTNKIPLRNSNGEIEGVLGAYMEITERKKAEEELRVSKKELADIIDFLPDATFAIDLEGKVVTWNKAMERMTGVRKEDMIGHGDQSYSIPFYGIRQNMLLDRLLHEDEKVRKRHDGVIGTGSTLFAETFCNALNNGRGAHVRAAATALRDDHGNRIGAIESIRDVTERRKLDLQLEEQMKELRAFYSLAEIAQRENITLNEMYNELVKILPDSWQYPEIAWARVVIGRNEFRTGNFKESEWKQSAPIKVNREEVGRIEVGYVEERPERDEGPFLKEERRLLEAISERLGHITERKLTDEALRESENRFEQLAVQSGTVIWEIDADGLYVYVGHASEAVLGYRPDELVGKKHFYDLIPKSEAESLKRVVFSIFKNREQFIDFENTMQTKDGRVVWVSTSGIPLLNADGTLRGYQGSDTDITERKLAEEALKESEARVRTYFESSPEGIFIVDGTGNYRDVNATGCSMLGYSREEMLTMNIISIVDKAAAQAALDGFMSLKEKGMMAMETVLTSKGGVRIPTFLNAVELPGSLYMAFCTDITERKRAEEALHQANNKLNILNTVTRHDINNQMMVLNGFLELSKSRNKDSGLAHYFDKMSAAAVNLQSQIAFTKNYQELGIKAPTWASVSKRIAEAFAMLNPPGVKLENGTAGLEVLTDPLADKVQYNLIDNSMRHGERVTHIRMSTEQVGDSMLIIYEDDGVGITVEDKKRLFQKGFGKNTGYGLFLIREILAITGITITEKGQPGKGVRFEMLVPPGAWRFNPPK